MMLFELSI